MEKTLGEDHNPLFGLKPCNFQFALVALQEGEAEVVKNLIGTTFSIAEQHGGVVMDIMPPLVVVTFEQNEKNRREFGAAIQERLKSHAKSIHGSKAGHIGMMGTDTRLSYNFIIPGFTEVIQELLALPFGQNKEV